MTRKLAIKSNNTTQKVYWLGRDRRSRRCCSLGPGAKQPRWKHRGDRRSVRHRHCCIYRVQKTKLQDDHMYRHKDVETVDDNEQDKDWRDNIKMGEQNVDNLENALLSLKSFNWYETDVCVELTWPDTSSNWPHNTNARSTLPLLRWPKSTRVRDMEIDKSPSTTVKEAAQLEWTLLIVFTPDKHWILRYLYEYRELIALNFKDSYPVSWKNECPDLICKLQRFLTLHARYEPRKIEIVHRDK